MRDCWHETVTIYGYGLRCLVLLLVLVTAGYGGASARQMAVVEHEIHLRLDPDSGQIRVRDRIRLPEEWSGELRFALHPGLHPSVEESDARLKRLSGPDGGAGPEEFLLDAGGRGSVTLRYAGAVGYPRFPGDVGPISRDGVQLGPASYWYPRFGDELVRFRMQVEMPEGWYSMSQGERQLREDEGDGVTEVWAEPQPQQGVHIAAGPFHRYMDDSGPVPAIALLREPDQDLADLYLRLTGEYIERYSRLIGDYPYPKFAVVENYWESGLGFPSYTLLGSRVLRLPFIPHTSYPHEILHSWWGNGVYVDMREGNWSEGLTTYLADHLMAELRGEAESFRRSALQRLTEARRAGELYPLRDFRGRSREDGNGSRAVGYDHATMLFHTLRLRLGDEAFVDGLKRFYGEHVHTRAGFADIRGALEAESGENLAAVFRQSLTRASPPKLQVSGVESERRDDGGYLLRATLEQTYGAEPFDLRVPVAVKLARTDEAWESTVPLVEESMELELELPEQPLALYVDPRFDVIRELHHLEAPPVLGGMSTPGRITVVLPADAAAEQLTAYADLVQSLAGGRDVVVHFDSELDALPSSGPVWILGWDNRFRDLLAGALQDHAVELDDEGAMLDGHELARDTHGVMLAARHPDNAGQTLAWLAQDDGDVLAGMVRRLRHYRGRSYVVFEAGTGEAIAADAWDVLHSPLWLPVKQQDGSRPSPGQPSLPPRPPLGD